jgi:hypothetical protein
MPQSGTDEEDQPGHDRERKAYRRTVSAACLLVLLAVASPITENFSDEPKDNYPLSHYPMFTVT